MKQKFVNKIKKTIETFLKTEASSGIILLICALIAMTLANGPWKTEYFNLLKFKIFGLNIQAWANDGLMTIFFFVISMEIKKELIMGELRSPKQAMLPLVAAFGGMICPALIYYYFNPDLPSSLGFGIPMATDIAFALGFLTLFGNKVPLSLKIFLLAIAIIDDLGAILVIAFIYTHKIQGLGLSIALISLAFIILMKSIRVKSYLVYIFFGSIVWLGVLLSGIHATIAGVIIGLITPLTYIPKKNAIQNFFSPLDHLVKKLHPWVSFGVMPIFILANAGINITGSHFSLIINHSIFKGVALGLIFGKPIGIIIFSAIAVKFKIAQLPSGLKWKNIIAVGFLGGIGLTMALFISGLALTPEQEIYSKIGIISGSMISALLGIIFLAASFITHNLPE